jgi:diguanylate cyclase (GGDEF)-like protein/PAS domain S-box-containing protein
MAVRRLPRSLRSTATSAAPEGDAASDARFLSLALEHVEDAVLGIDTAGVIRYLNPAAEHLTGHKGSRALGRNLKDLLGIGLTKAAGAGAMRAELTRLDGLILDIEYRVLEDTSGLSVMVARDVSRQSEQALELDTTLDTLHEEANALFTERERAQVTLDSIGDAVASTDFRGHVVYLNQAAERMTGFSQSQAAAQPVADVFKLQSTERRTQLPCPATAAIIANAKRVSEEPCNLIHRDGSQTAVEVAATPIHDRIGGVVGAVMVARDVTLARGLAQRLEHLALHDALTELPNRTLFHDRLAHEMSASHRSGCSFSLMYVDLDHFKQINDTHGHTIGDQVLKLAARRMLGCVRETDTVCRYGGDEFLVLLSACSHRNGAGVCAAKLLATLAAPYDVGGLLLRLSVSIGIALFPMDANDVPALIKAADSAMYRAKLAGRDRAEYFKPDAPGRWS